MLGGAAIVGVIAFVLSLTLTGLFLGLNGINYLFGLNSYTVIVNEEIAGIVKFTLMGFLLGAFPLGFLAYLHDKP